MPALEPLVRTWRSLRFGLPVARLRPEAPRTVADAFEEQATARPGHPFLLFEDRRISYAAFDAAANRVARWAQAQGLGGKKYAELAREEKIYQLIKQQVDAVNGTLAKYETIKKFALLPSELTIESGELTPSLKVKRKAAAAGAETGGGTDKVF